MEVYARHPSILCIVCDKPIYRRPSEITRNKGNVFCSLACYGKHNRKENPCTVCSKPIMARLHKKTCSRSCSNIHRTGIRYKMNRPRDKVSHHKALKLRLIKIRGEKCEYSKIQILQVHHKDKNRKNSDLDNLELICPNCHYEEHFLEKSWLNSYNLRNWRGRIEA